MANSVVGNYESVTAAETAVKALLDNGYPKESLTLIVNKKIVPPLRYDDIKVESGFMAADGDEDESFWDRVKGFFTNDDETDPDATINAEQLDQYQQDLDNGNILLVVDDAYTTATPMTDTADTSMGATTAYAATRTAEVDSAKMGAHAAAEAHTTAAGDNDTKLADEHAHDYAGKIRATTNTTDHDDAHDDTHDGTIKLHEEKLNIDKNKVQTGEAKIHKNVVEETKTIEVPVTREELVIERHPVKDGEVAADADITEDTITIPLTEEQVHVTKEPVVTEEIHIRKQQVQDNKAVTDTVRKEKLNVENTGNAVINDDNAPKE